MTKSFINVIAESCKPLNFELALSCVFPTIFMVLARPLLLLKLHHFRRNTNAGTITERAAISSIEDPLRLLTNSSLSLLLGLRNFDDRSIAMVLAGGYSGSVNAAEEEQRQRSPVASLETTAENCC